RLARSDLSVADSSLARAWARLLPRSLLAWVRGQYALVAATALVPRAYDWYREAGHIRMPDHHHAWKVRSALRQQRVA
ncbi:lytic transglycosylase domain-containing protein, partial [Bordetella holmesii]|nr:lytic transglycosylase domain-containing protein [Bordetella holmesii]